VKYRATTPHNMKITAKMLERAERLRSIRKQIKVTYYNFNMIDGLLIQYTIQGVKKEIECDVEKGIRWMETAGFIDVLRDGYIFDRDERRHFERADYFEAYEMGQYEALEICAQFEYLLQ